MLEGYFGFLPVVPVFSLCLQFSLVIHNPSIKSFVVHQFNFEVKFTFVVIELIRNRFFAVTQSLIAFFFVVGWVACQVNGRLRMSRFVHCCEAFGTGVACVGRANVTGVHTDALQLKPHQLVFLLHTLDVFVVSG